jgi:hypothetical protein
LTLGVRESKAAARANVALLPAVAPGFQGAALRADF